MYFCGIVLLILIWVFWEGDEVGKLRDVGVFEL